MKIKRTVPSSRKLSSNIGLIDATGIIPGSYGGSGGNGRLGGDGGNGGAESCSHGGNYGVGGSGYDCHGGDMANMVKMDY